MKSLSARPHCRSILQVAFIVFLLHSGGEGRAGSGEGGRAGGLEEGDAVAAAPPGGGAGTHYLREGMWSPLIWEGALRSSSSWANREKWSDGMWGCGQPVTLFSTSQWGSRGPKIPNTFR